MAIAATDTPQRRANPADPINSAQAFSQARARSPMPNVTGNLIDAGQEAEQAARQGNYAGAAGQLLGGVIRTPVAAMHDIGSALVPPVEAVGRFGRGVVSGSPAQAATVPTRPAASAPTQQSPSGMTSTAGAGRGAAMLTDPVVGQGAMGPASLTEPILGGQFGADVTGAPGVKKFTQGGRTLYSNVPGAESNDSLMAGKGGTVSVMPSAVGQLVQPTGNAGADAGLAAARLAAANRGDFASVAASYGGNFNGGGMTQPAGGNPLVDQITAGLQSGKQLTARGAQALLDLQRNQTAEGAQQLAAQRLTMEGPGLRADTAVKQLTARNAQDLEAARQAYLNATTPEAKKTAELNLRALTGKFDQESFTTQVMQGQVDALGNKSPAVAVITNKNTGETRLVDASGRPIDQGQAQAKPLPTDKKQLAVGTVYQTSRGAAKWDGTQFIPQ